MQEESQQKKSKLKGDGSDGSVSAGSGNDPLEDNNSVVIIEQQHFSPPAKKRRFHKHTPHQLQELEALFKKVKYPNDEQRTKLSQEIGLNPRQIKHWFQNRRCQFKAEQSRRETAMLLAENESLKTEIYNLESDLKLVCCSCGGSVDEIRLQNSLLRQEILEVGSQLCSITANPYLPPSLACYYFPEIAVAEEEKPIVRDLAVSYAKELVKMCDANDLLWNKKKSVNEEDNDGLLCLDEDEFKKTLKSNDNGDRCFRIEASRANGVVFTNSITLVNTFLDADKWSDMFCSIVSKAKTVQIISSRDSESSGYLLLMYAEFQALTPLVPARDGYFIRYAEQNVEQRKWLIVDFPVDSSLTKKASSSATNTNQYRRKPSGCIIQDLLSGYSQVTWMENVEVEEEEDMQVNNHHEAIREYVNSGIAFGANRWLAVLKRQCERMANFMASNIKDLGVIPSIKGRKNLMTLSHKMMRSFCLNINDSYGQVSFESTRKDLVKITTKNVCGSVLLCAVSTTLLPYSHYQVFDLFSDNHRRPELKSLFNWNSFQQVVYITCGSRPGNCISLLRNDVEFLLQETCIDNSGGLVLYSTIVKDAVQLVINNDKDDSSVVPLFPIGFSIVPINPKDGVEGNSVSSPSSLLSIVIHVNAVAAELDTSTIAAIDNRICSTVDKIISALRSSNSSAAGN